MRWRGLKSRDTTGLELVVHTRDDGAAIPCVFQLLGASTVIGFIRGVAQVVDLQYQPDTLHRAAVERVADLEVDNVLAHHITQRAVVREIADLAEEVGTTTLADASSNQLASRKDLLRFLPAKRYEVITGQHITWLY